MDTYLDRPVFPFEATFSDVVQGEFVWAAVLEGNTSGAEIDLSKWVYGKRRFDVSSWATYGGIKKFFTRVRGSKCGFWLPYANYTMEVVGTVDASNILVSGADVAERNDPCMHLCFTDAERKNQFSSISSMVVVGANTLITLTAALDPLPDANWSISPLYYVRLASDELSLTWQQTECEATFSCLEQPSEYEDVQDDDTSRIYLYEIGYILGGKENMQRFTSWGTLVQGVDDTVWDPRPIDHSTLSNDAEGAETSISCVSWSDCPLKDMFPKADGLPLSIRIWEASWDWETKKETGIRQLLFSGELKKPQEKGRLLSASCMDGHQANDRSAPVIIKTRNCQVGFCSTKCGLSRSLYCVKGVVDMELNSSLYYVDVIPSGSINTSRLVLGYLVTDDYHTATPSKYWAWQPIQGVTALGDGSYRLQIRQPFNRLTKGDIVWLYYGCNRSVAACKAYGNYQKFRGAPNTPLKDPKTVVSAYTTTSGGKK